MLKLAAFDLDGTLKVERDSYIYLHRRLGVTAKAEAIITAVRNGQLTYTEWLRAYAELWRGTKRSTLLQFFREVAYVPGTQKVIQTLQAHNVQIAIISSGFLIHSNMVAAELGIKHIFSNELLFEGDPNDPTISGDVRAHVPIGSKQALLTQLQADLNIQPAQTLAVGDTHGDLGLFARAAVSVAINPNKPEVADAADIVLPDLDLRPLLPRLHAHAPEFWRYEQH